MLCVAKSAPSYKYRCRSFMRHPKNRCRWLLVLSVVGVFFVNALTAEERPDRSVIITPFPVLRADPGIQWVDNDTILMLAFDRPGRAARWITWSLDGRVTPLKSLGNTDIDANSGMCTTHSTIYHSFKVVSSDGKISRIVEVNGAAHLVETNVTGRSGPGSSLVGFDCFSAFDSEMAGRVWKPLLEQNRYLDFGPFGRFEAEQPVQLVFADNKPYQKKDLGFTNGDVGEAAIKYYAFRREYFALVKRYSWPANWFVITASGERCWKAWWFNSEGVTSKICLAIPQQADIWSIVPVKTGYVVASSLGLHFFAAPIISDGKVLSADFVGRVHKYPNGAASLATSPDGCRVAAIAGLDTGNGDRLVPKLIVEDVCAAMR